MSNRVFKFFSSLRLTVTLLAFGILLVFVGTVAQADEGLYQAQVRYFRHWFVWGITMFGYKVPLGLPGGYLIGTLLLVNLTAAHIKRFQLTTKKLGIHLTHAGVILLLVGQLTTDLFSRETQLRFAEGETKSWSESDMNYELAFLTEAGAENDQVVAIPQGLLKRGSEIKHEKLPFTIHIKDYWRNSEPSFRAPMQANAPPLTTNGVARYFDFRATPVTHKMDDKNVPVAILELTGTNGSLGTWVAAGWSGDEVMAGGIGRVYARQMGAEMAKTIAGRLTEPQSVEAGGRKFTLTLRPARVYKPFSLTLLKATHEVYRGTVTAANPEGIPKNFQSRVRLQNPARHEDREVDIYMNNPLRYAGLTFYQYQMAAGDMVQQAGEISSSTLQVVRNPSWLTPYAGCVIVAAGLVIQFMIHLVGFVSKRKAI
jgi:ResB-like family